MKAMVIREFGGPEVLRLEEVERPAVSPDGVLIKVEAVSVNRTLDLVVRAGRYARAIKFPHVLGADPTGTIVEVGSKVKDRKVGDRVATSPRLTQGSVTQGPVMLGVQAWGGYAEYVALPETVTHLIPDDLDFPEATVIARHAPLAFNMLQQKARIKSGDWVLVMGAAGGLGSLAVQVAKYLGGRVIAAAGSREHADSALAFGADAAVDYRNEDLTKRAREITDGRGVDIVLENIGDPELFPKAFASLARYGRLVTAGAHAGGIVPLDLSFLYLNQIAIFGSPGHTDADVQASLTAAARGKLTAVIDKILPLSDAAAAHRMVAAGGGLRKIILRPTMLQALA